MFTRAHVVLFTLFASVLGAAQRAHALTVDCPVTPAYVRENPGTIEVVAEKRADGLVAFKVTLHVPRPSYVVAHSRTTDKNQTQAETSSPAFVREKSAEYYIALAPERIADTHFDLFMGTFADSNGDPVPLPGGINYQIALAEFAKTAKAAGK